MSFVSSDLLTYITCSSNKKFFIADGTQLILSIVVKIERPSIGIMGNVLNILKL